VSPGGVIVIVAILEAAETNQSSHYCWRQWQGGREATTDVARLIWRIN